MSPAHEEWEGALTVLSVGEDEATIRDFRCDCRGETSCRAELGEIVQLLERRRADVAVFYCHPDLAGGLVEQLRRSDKSVPPIVIATHPDSDQAGVGVCVWLPGLSAAAHPYDILARLYQALCAVQGAGPNGGGDRSGSSVVPAGDAAAVIEGPARAQPPARYEPASPPANPPDGASPNSAAGDSPTADEDPAGAVVVGADDDRAPSAEVSELGARLERILEQRLRRKPHA
ncbi:MAG TPA: hypothetical protein VM221_06150 [Armatimonadota bacterium]|nr:hypothetical protein [Armatimonadota bacterium]